MRRVQKPLTAPKRKLVNHVCVDALPNIEIGRATELARLINVLNHRTVLPGRSFSRRGVIYGMGHVWLRSNEMPFDSARRTIITIAL